jgi:hypothetical protein
VAIKNLGCIELQDVALCLWRSHRGAHRGRSSEAVFQENYSWKGWHVFITGGSEGCGYEVAKILLQKHSVKAVTLFIFKDRYEAGESKSRAGKNRRQ